MTNLLEYNKFARIDRGCEVKKQICWNITNLLAWIRDGRGRTGRTGRTWTDVTDVDGRDGLDGLDGPMFSTSIKKNIGTEILFLKYFGQEPIKYQTQESGKHMYQYLRIESYLNRVSKRDIKQFPQF